VATAPHGHPDATTGRVPRPRSRTGPVVAGIAALAVIGAGLGILAGRQTGETDVPPPEARTASLPSGIRLQVPEAWPATTPAAPAGFAFRDGASVGATDPAGGGVVAGFVVTTDPSYLPPALAADAPEPERVQLAGMPGLRYTGLPAGSGPPVTAYAVPTSRGVATLVCLPGGPDSTVTAACGDAAASLAVRGARVFPAGPSAPYARAFAGVMEGLATRVRRGRAQLAEARLPGPQAVAAQDLARVYAEAADALPTRDLSPAGRVANARMAAALRDVAAGYRRMAAAAADDDADGWTAGRAAVRRGEAALAAARTALGELGYSV
jgi:hypothetical protein